MRDFDELKSLAPEKVSGKIVLFNHAFDKQMAAQGHAGDAYGQAVVYRSDGPVAAAKLGAVACLIRSVGGAVYRIPHTGQTNYKDGVPKIPAAAVTAEDADLITDLVGQGPARMHFVSHAANLTRCRKRKCHRRHQGERTSGASCNRLGSSRFMGPGNGRDR